MTMLSPGYSRVPSKKVSPFGPAKLPSTADIQTNIYARRALLYRYIYIHMLAKADQSAEPIGLTFLRKPMDTFGETWAKTIRFFKFYGQR